MGTSNNRAKSLSREREIRSVTANTEIAGNDDILLVDASSGNVTVILPVTTGVIKRHYTIKKTDSSSNTVTISRSDPDTIEGSNTHVLNKPDEFVELHATSGEWIIVAGNSDDTVDDVITAQGDIVQGSSTGTPERLAKGSSGEFLKAGASTNSWAAIAASDVQSGTFADARISESSVTQHEAAIDHDALTNFVANEHIDWTVGQGATNIHDGNIPQSSVVQHEAALTLKATQVGNHAVEALDKYSDLKAVTTPTDKPTVCVRGKASLADGNGGIFIWRSGDRSTNVTNDPQELEWVPPDSDATGASGAWQKLNQGNFYAYDSAESGITISDFSYPPGHVRRYGAVGDGSTDDATAINRAFDYARAAEYLEDGWNSTYGIVDFGTGQYKVNSTINATDLNARGARITGDGAVIIGHCTGDPVIDMVKTRYIDVENLTIIGDATNTPSIGIQQGRDSSGLVVDTCTFTNIHYDGEFSTACHVNYAAETCSYNQCSFYNQDTSSTSAAFVIDTTNSIGITSDFKTVSSGVSSHNANYFVGCNFVTSAGGAGPSIRINASTSAGGEARDIVFHECYYNTVGSVAGGGTPGPIFFVDGPTINLHITGRGEVSGDVTHIVEFDTSSAVSTHEGFMLREHYLASEDGAIDGSSASNGVVINGGHMEAYIAQGSTGFFGNTSNIIFRGTIKTGSDTVLTDISNCDTFSGILHCAVTRANVNPAGAGHYFAFNSQAVLDMYGTLSMESGHIINKLPIVVKSYTVATVPTASTYPDGVIIVSDETGGRTLATSDGTNWRRVSDGAIVS